MLITTSTSIAFILPEESERASKFAADHPDWQVNSSGNVLQYTNSSIFVTSSITTEEKEQV